MTKMEEWRPIKKSRGQYEVSSEGRIRNARTGRILSTKTKPYRSPAVSLNGFMGGRSYTIGRLVAEAFLGEVNGRVYHMDGDKQNNNIKNLIVYDNYE